MKTKNFLTCVIAVLAVITLIQLNEINSAGLYEYRNLFPIIISALCGLIVGSKSRILNPNTGIHKNKNENIVVMLLVVSITPFILNYAWNWVNILYIICMTITSLILYSRTIAEKKENASGIRAYMYITIMPFIIFIFGKFFAQAEIIAFGILIGSSIFYLFNFLKTDFQEFNQKNIYWFK